MNVVEFPRAAAAAPAHDARRAHVEALRESALAASQRGDLDHALTLCEQAHELTLAIGDQRLTDVALCNRGAIAVELRCATELVPEMREILVRSGDPSSCRLAAYNIARHYELAKNPKKALFYAQIAAQSSTKVGRAEWVASSHNQIGNLLLAQSQLDAACREYEQALASMPADDEVWRAQVLDNLGYSWVLRGNVREGMGLLYQSLRLMRRHRAEGPQVPVRLDLCWAHLEEGRLPQARRHGEAALELAERFQNVDGIKNALYLLGQTANMAGDPLTARRHFVRLERQFGGSADMTELLLAVDVRRMINLKA